MKKYLNFLQLEKLISDLPIVPPPNPMFTCCYWLHLLVNLCYWIKIQATILKDDQIRWIHSARDCNS